MADRPFEPMTSRAFAAMVERAKMNGCELAFIVMEFIELTEASGLHRMDGTEEWARTHANAKAWINYVANGGPMPDNGVKTQ